MNLKFVKRRGSELYNSKKVKKEHKEERKADEETVVAEEELEVPFPLVTHVNNILHWFFSNVEEYINNQQIYNSTGTYSHKSSISNNFKGAISEYKAFLQSEWYHYEEFPEKFIGSTFFHKENENA